MHNYDSINNYHANEVNYPFVQPKLEEPGNQATEGTLVGKKVGKVKERLREVTEKIDLIVSEALQQSPDVNPFENPQIKAAIQLIIYDSQLPLKYMERLSEKIDELSRNYILEQKSPEIEFSPPPSPEVPVHPYSNVSNTHTSEDPFAYYYTNPYQNSSEGFYDFPSLSKEQPPPVYSNPPPAQPTPADTPLDFPSNELKNLIDNGLEDAIMNYLNTNIPLPSVDRLLVQGPQKKNEETCILEEVISVIFKDPDQLTFEIKPNTFECYIKDSQGETVKNADGKPVELGDLLKKANMNHISLSKEQLNEFKAFFNNTHLSKDVHLKINSRYIPTNPKLPEEENELSRIEKAALQLYISETHFSPIQKLLQGRVDEFVQDFNSSEVDAFLKPYLLIGVVGVSALNRLPDFESNQDSQFLYRYDMSLPDSKIQERIHAVHEGGLVTTETGFISTSHSRPAEFFKDGNVITLFEQCKAKSVENLSPLNEREVTLPPTQVQWKYHHEFIDHSGKKIHLFVAKAVTTPTEASTRLPDETIPQSD